MYLSEKVSMEFLVVFFVLCEYGMERGEVFEVMRLLRDVSNGNKKRRGNGERMEKSDILFRPCLAKPKVLKVDRYV